MHLLLFNLTLQHSKAYFNLVNVILPYTRDNWHALQLPPKVSDFEFYKTQQSDNRGLFSSVEKYAR